MVYFKFSKEVVRAKLRQLKVKNYFQDIVWPIKKKDWSIQKLL